MVARRERRVANGVELGFVQATAAVDVRRGGQAVACGVERRHIERGLGGGETSQDGVR